MNQYLGPLLRTAKQFLAKELPDGNHLTAQVPIYLIATGGMRSIPKADQDRILDMAYKLIKAFGKTFNASHRETTVRVIPGELEGLFSWVALNYARQSTDDPLLGLTEMGGASTQFAFEDHSDRVANKTLVCLPSKSDGHEVYSATWDGYGANTMRANMLQLLSNDAGSQLGVIDNPCLPLGAPGKPFGTATQSSVGTGDWKDCLAVAKRLLVEGAKTRGPIPSYPDIQPVTDTDHVLSLSTYWYTYEFFGQYGSYDINGPYDPMLFGAAVRKYCSHEWGTLPIQEDKYTEARCFGAAWMLTLLHNRRHGFGLETSQYNQTSKGLVLFPTTPELVDRSSWTMGVASLLAEHDGLVFCPWDDELAVARSYLTTTYGRELPAIVLPTVYPMSDFNQIESSKQATGTGELGWQSLLLTLVSRLGCGLVMVALLHFVYRSIRSRYRFTSGKVRLPPDVEDGYCGDGKKEYRGLMDVKHGL